MPKKPTWATPKAPKAVKELVSKKSAKQIVAATKNILAYEKKDDFENITIGFFIGAATVLIATFIVLGL